MPDPHCRTNQSDSGNTEPGSDTNRVDESDTYDEPTDGTNKQDDYQGWSSNPINKEWVPRSRYKREQNKIKRQELTAVFNKSNFILTDKMEKVMNRGLNFGVLSKKLDITQVFVDLKKFDRTMIWKEWWHGHTTEEEYDKPMFKTHKTNLPANYKVPNGLKTYLSSVKSEVVDPKNRNKVKCSLPEDELEALKELVKLQKDKKIIIKQCDKGAGIIVLNYEDYINACNKHLKESMKDHDGTIKQYYKKVKQTVLEEAKNKILRHIQSDRNRQKMRERIKLGLGL